MPENINLNGCTGQPDCIGTASRTDAEETYATGLKVSAIFGAAIAGTQRCSNCGDTAVQQLRGHSTKAVAAPKQSPG